MICLALALFLHATELQGRAPDARDSAQSGTIRGTVVDGSTGGPLSGVVVVLEGSDGQAVTGPDGAFSFAGVAVGRHTLFVSLIGYALARPVVDVTKGGTTTVVVPLAGGTGAYNETVTIVADPFRGTASAVPAAMVLTSAEILELRGVLTDDPLRAVQALPSVATGDDFRSEFSVRGSDYAHLGLTIDDMPIGWPVHTVRDREAEGSISLVNGDVIESAALLAGAYPQDRPGRTGAWLDLTMREGSRGGRRIHGSLSASAASAVLEGPLRRRGSWLVSARRSYLQWLLDRMDEDGGTAFGFTDVQAKLVVDATSRQQLQVTVVGGRAKLRDEHARPDQNSVGHATARTGLVSLGLRSTRGSTLVLTQRLAVAATDFRTDATLGATLADGSSSRLAYRASLDWAAAPALSLNAGMYVQREGTHEAYIRFQQVPRGPSYAITERVNGSASMGLAHVRAAWRIGRRLSVDAGVMEDGSTLVRSSAWSPWLLLRAPLRAGMMLRAGFDRHRQVPGIDQVAGTFAGVGVRRERARQVEVALEQQIAPALRWQVTAYDRRERDILRLHGSEAYIEGERIVLPSAAPFWAQTLSGTSRGIEVQVQRRATSGLTGWIGYAYGRARSADRSRREAFWGDFDQRHTLNLFAQQRLSARTSVSGKLRVGSNFPIPGYLTERGGALWLGSSRNAVRLPRYVRLDLRANHTFNLDRRRLTLFVEAINLLDRDNYAADTVRIQASGRVTGERHSLFPFLPSAGLVIDF